MTVEEIGAEALVAQLRIKLGFPRETFSETVVPVLQTYAQMLADQDTGVQGRRLNKALALACRALDHRRLHILPRGAIPEAIAKGAHRWSYAVFVAALVRDVRAIPETQDASASAQPTTESARRFLRHLLPPAVFGWLENDPQLMKELVSFVGRESGASMVEELVRRASADLGGEVDDQAGGVALAGSGTDGQGGAQQHAVSAARKEPDSLEAVDDPGGQEPVLSGGPSQGAERFMTWLRAELAAARIRVNAPGACVHMVREGMLLVSPRIFREFADCSALHGEPQRTEHLPDRIRAEVLKAEWHLKDEGGGEALVYQVMRAGRAVAQIQGMVMLDPARFVQPVPALNPVLVRSKQQGRG